MYPYSNFREGKNARKNNALGAIFLLNRKKLTNRDGFDSNWWSFWVLLCVFWVMIWTKHIVNEISTINLAFEQSINTQFDEDFGPNYG